MDSSLLDQNTVSIIRSPNKQFYHMAALDSNDLEHFCGPREYKLPDNGHHSNDMVNGWHRHSSEQVASDNVAAIRNYKLSEQLPNNEMNCICYPPSSGLQLSINRKITSIDLLNSNLAVGQADSFPPIPNTSSEAYLLVDDNEHNSIASLEGKLHGNQGHSNNDIVNTISMTELSDPASVHHESEGCYNPAHVKPKRSPRKSVKKSKSSYNNCNNSWKNCGQRLNSETEDSKQYNIQMKSEISIEDVISNGFSVQPCSSPLSSRPTLCCYVNTEVNSKSENSDGKRDSGSSGNEEGVTSGVASTGHESTAIDQIWDGYQAPLYVAISDDSTEEKLDATHLLQSEWQPMTDEFMDFSDFGNDYSSQHLSSELDSDSDAEEMLHLIKESSDALRLTRSSLNQLKLSDGSMQSSLHREPLATCSTNISCLRDLLGIVSQKDWTHAKVSQLSDLLKHWEDVESEFLRQTSQKELSIVRSDVILDVSPNAIPLSPVSQKINNCSSGFDMAMKQFTSSPSCYFKCSNKSFSNRFDVFISNVSKLLKGTSPLHQAALTPIQIVFFILLFLVFCYFIAFKSHWTDVVGIRFDPQLRYVIGPPPL